MPSTARTIFLYPSQTPQGARPLSWGTKPAAANLDYTLDCSPFLADADNDTLLQTSPTLTCASTDITLTAQSSLTTGTAFTFDISGGVPGANYNLNFSFSTFAETLTVTGTILLSVE
jgi:hypothetical protein